MLRQCGLSGARVVFVVIGATLILQNGCADLNEQNGKTAVDAAIPSGSEEEAHPSEQEASRGDALVTDLPQSLEVGSLIIPQSILVTLQESDETRSSHLLSPDIIRQAEKGIEDTPNSAWPRVVLAQLYEADDQNTRALEILVAAAEVDPQAAEPLMGIAELIYKATIGPLASRNLKRNPDLNPLALPGKLDDEARESFILARQILLQAKGKKVSKGTAEDGSSILLYPQARYAELLSRLDEALYVYWGERGDAQANESHFSDAEEAFVQAQIYKPRHISALHNRTVCRLRARGLWPIDERSVLFLKQELEIEDYSIQMGSLIVLLSRSIEVPPAKQAYLEAKLRHPELIEKMSQLDGMPSN